MANLRDVARNANVSVGTVSKILNTGTELHLISDECISRVRRAAQEVGYRPNYHARSLQTGRSNTIGVAVLGPSNSNYLGGFWGTMIGGMDMAARARGFQFIVVGAGEASSGPQQGLQALDERRIDALIVPGYVASAVGAMNMLERSRAPVVLTEYEERTSLPVVRVDNMAGFDPAVEHLAGLGHRRILWIGPELPANKYVRRRREAFRHAAEVRGLESSDLFVDCSDAREGAPVAAARARAIEHFSRDRSFAAVVCYMEPLAFGVYAALAELGLRVPGDVSIVGFDDFHPYLTYPPMTEIKLRIDDVGRRAAELAVEMLETPGAWKRLRGYDEVLPATLSVRESTGPAPGS